MYLFETILKLEERYLEYKGIKNLKVSKLNLFIGINNSGKSRLIRNIINIKKKDYKFENTYYLPENNVQLDKLEEIFSKIDFSKNEKNSLSIKELYDSKESKEITEIIEINSIEKVKDKLKKIMKNQELTLNNIFLPLLTSCLEELKDYERSFENPYVWNNIFDEIRKVFQNYYDSVADKLVNLYEDNSLKQLYIPTLRGLRTFKENKNVYLERTETDYFQEKNGLEVFTGLELYSKLQGMLLGEYEEREKVRNFEEFLSSNFFESKRVSLIPKIKDTVLHIKIGDAEERPIYELGDGVQSIIILTFPLFENAGKDMLIGIEEPEIYLHPGMQRKLMEVLLDKKGIYGFENFQYLITTHSNHFLDLTLDYPEDVIVYESKKVEDSKFEITRKNDKNMLGLMESLGIRSSSVFLANSTVWIEGISERLYFRKYFKIYQEKMLEEKRITKIYEEDKHFAFLEYSGGNITHWSFLDEEEGINALKVSNKIFLLSDTDGCRGKENDDGTPHEKALRIEKLESSTDIDSYLLECREIENLLTSNVIKKLLLEYKEDEEIVESLDFKQEDYKDIGIGSYIEDVLFKDKEMKRKSYKAKSGTIIGSKADFTRRACKYIENYDDLSDETKAICEKLYDFIARANGDRD